MSILLFSSNAANVPMRNCTSSLLHPHKLNSNPPKSKHPAKMLIHATPSPVVPTNKLKPPRRTCREARKRLISRPRLLRSKPQPYTMSLEKLAQNTVLVRSPIIDCTANKRDGTDQVVSKPLRVSSLGLFYLFCQSKTVPSVAGNMLF